MQTLSKNVMYIYIMGESIYLSAPYTKHSISLKIQKKLLLACTKVKVTFQLQLHTF